MSTDADGRARLEFIVPTRGLIGYRGQLLSDTRGTALLHQIGEGYGPMAGEVTHRTGGGSSSRTARASRGRTRSHRSSSGPSSSSVRRPRYTRG